MMKSSDSDEVLPCHSHESKPDRWTRMSNRETNRSCFCFHVRTATIGYATFHVFVNVMLFSSLVIALNRPSLLSEKQPVEADLVETSLSSYMLPESGDKIYINKHHHRVKSSVDYYTWYARLQHWGAADIRLAMFITVCAFILSAMLLYGALRFRPIFLMPFFCFQVLDLGISFVTLTNYLFNMPNVQAIVTSSDGSLRGEQLNLKPNCLTVGFFVLYIANLFIQIYFLNMVWTCYKYLVVKQFMGSTVTSYVIPDAESSQPPDYEKAVKLPQYFVDLETPPPYPALEEESNRPDQQQQQQDNNRAQVSQA